MTLREKVGTYTPIGSVDWDPCDADLLYGFTRTTWFVDRIILLDTLKGRVRKELRKTNE